MKRNLDPINGGCWFCHKAIENNEEYGFSMEWDAYFHTNCLEQALLSDDIRTRREAQVVAREFRIEFEEHEEDFCMIIFIRVVMCDVKGIYGLWQSV